MSWATKLNIIGITTIAVIFTLTQQIPFRDWPYWITVPWAVGAIISCIQVVRAKR